MFANNGGYSYLNRMNQDFSGASFSDKTYPTGPNVLNGIHSGAQAANASILKLNGGGGSKRHKINRRKIKNISNKYKMSSRRIKSHKRSLRKRLSKRCLKGGTSSRKGGGRRRTRKHVRFSKRASMKGGSTVAYGLANGLPSALSALANPMPFIRVDGASCQPYNHYTGKNVL